MWSNTTSIQAIALIIWIDWMFAAFLLPGWFGEVGCIVDKIIKNVISRRCNSCNNRSPCEGLVPNINASMLGYYHRLWILKLFTRKYFHVAYFVFNCISFARLKWIRYAEIIFFIFHFIIVLQKARIDIEAPNCKRKKADEKWTKENLWISKVVIQ